MDTRELRIGNWVQLNGKGRALPNLQSAKYYQITRIGKSFAYIEDMHVNDVEALSLIDPVLLTEELLLKCGFEIMSDDLIKFTLPHTTYRISFTRGAVYKDIGKGSEHWFLHVDNFDCATIGCGRLEFLHQLQNLYFALIGEELKVKL